MAITLTTRRLVSIIKQVPEKKFLILELAPQLMDTHGHVDVIKAMDKQDDIALAVAEVASYIREVRKARETVECLWRGGKAHEDDEHDWDEEDGE